MKEAIGTSFVFNLIMVFTGVMIALVVGALAYSKAFKIRNRIIDIIHKYGEYNELAKVEIEENLAAIGYRIVDKSCPDKGGIILNEEYPELASDYRYCIYQHQAKRGNYYGVLVFMHFDIPLIGDFFEIPMYGETVTMYDVTIEG